MKDLKDIIYEGLKVTSKSKVNVNNSKSPLNVNINSLEELRDVMIEYFKPKYLIQVTKIDESPVKWSTQYGNDKITVGSHFTINFLKNGRLSDKLQFAEHKDGYLLMQMVVKDYSGKLRPCRIHGGSTYNTFKPGDNLFEFIQTIVKHTNENHSVDKDPNIIRLFKDI